MTYETPLLYAIKIDLEYRYFPEERPSRDSPGELEYAEIVAVRYNGVDIMDALNDKDLAHLERAALQDMQDHMAEAALANYEYRNEEALYGHL